MASAQCNRPANETCQQKCQGSSSLGQRMSVMASWAKGTHSQQETKPSYQAPAQAHSYPNQGTCKSQTHQACQCHTAAKPQPHCGVNKAGGNHHTHTHRHGHGHGHTKHQTTNGAAACHRAANKTNGRHNHNHLTNGGTAVNKERNLFRRIKDRISGNSSCSDSSDSESDYECCHKIKN